jgi:hypothetical protein
MAFAASAIGSDFKLARRATMVQAEYRHLRRGRPRRTRTEKSDHRHPRLLRARGERPRRRAAE